MFHDWLVTGKEKNLDVQGCLIKLLEASASNVAWADFVCRL